MFVANLVGERVAQVAWIRIGGCNMTCDLSYFRRRASEERTAALQSQDARVRRIHVAMAECYEELVRAMATRERILESAEG